VPRELSVAAGLQRDSTAAGEVLARNALVSQGFARSPRRAEKRGENAEIRHEGDRGRGGGKRGDQRAETVVRRGAQFNRIADSHRIVVYRLRAGMGGANLRKRS
jgi:hypothetical protein